MLEEQKLTRRDVEPTCCHVKEVLHALRGSVKQVKDGSIGLFRLSGAHRALHH
jgi:hypothetical protein